MQANTSRNFLTNSVNPNSLNTLLDLSLPKFWLVKFSWQKACGYNYGLEFTKRTKKDNRIMLFGPWQDQIDTVKEGIAMAESAVLEVLFVLCLFSVWMNPATAAYNGVSHARGCCNPTQHHMKKSRNCNSATLCEHDSKSERQMCNIQRQPSRRKRWKTNGEKMVDFWCRLFHGLVPIFSRFTPIFHGL